jgi:hypothetical protein
MTKETKPLPPIFISQETVDKRKALFSAKKLPLLAGDLGRPDTQSIWYTREHVASLLAEIDYYGGDGLRIFFGAYEEGHQYEGQLCLVMNPTRAVGTGSASHKEVVAENEPDFAARSSQARDFQFSEDLDDTYPKGYNYGSPCPPLCD